MDLLIPLDDTCFNPDSSERPSANADGKTVNEYNTNKNIREKSDVFCLFFL